MKIKNLISVVALGFLNQFGLVFGAASAMVKCPDFYNNLYLESDILGKFEKLFDSEKNVQIDKT